MDEKELELADAITALAIESGIKRSRQRSVMPADFDGHCSCGDEIPQGRIAFGYYNCTECQTAFERRGKFFR